MLSCECPDPEEEIIDNEIMDKKVYEAYNFYLETLA